MAIGAILITAGCGSAPGTLCGGVQALDTMLSDLEGALLN